MKFQTSAASHMHRITGYGQGYIVVNESRLEGSVVILPDRLIDDWAPVTWQDITPESLAFLDTIELEIALLGTGSQQHFPTPEIMALFASKRIGLEVMNTPAACRTYNILLAEERPVAAMLIPTG